jgi:hypothetical protein
MTPVVNVILPRGGFNYPETPNLYKEWFSDTRVAASRRVVFFNKNDYALWNDCWQLNEYLKPDQSELHQSYTYTYDGADYSVIEDKFAKTVSSLGEKSALELGTATNSQDRFEIMAMAAESRSKAVGGVDDLTLDKPSIDLQNIWSVDAPDDGPKGSSGQSYGAHKWHSAEFRSTNIRQKGFWLALLDDRGFNIIDPSQ